MNPSAYSQSVQLILELSQEYTPHFHHRLAEIIEEKELFESMIQIAACEKNPLAFRAAWGIECAFFKNKAALYPHLSLFCNQFTQTQNESVRRSYAKMMYTLLETQWIESSRYEEIAEALVSWLIAPKTKVAVKVWCVRSLIALSPHVVWVKEAIESIGEAESLAPTPAMRIILREIKSFLAGNQR